MAYQARQAGMITTALVALAAAALIGTCAPAQAAAASPISLSDLLAPATPAEVGDLRIEPGLRARGGLLLSTGSLADTRIGRDLRRGFTVGTEADTVRIKPRPARPATARVRRSAALFLGVARETDVVVRPTATGVESFQRLNGPGAPRRFSWRISLTTGQHLEPLPDGGVAIIDTSERDALAGADDSGHVPPGSLPVESAPPPSEGLLGQLRLEELLPPAISTLLPAVPATLQALTKAVDDTGAQLSGAYEDVSAAEAAFPDARVVGVFAAPWAVDATGAQVPAHLTPRGSLLTLSVVPDAGSRYPITTDPAYSAALASKAAAVENAVPPEWQRGINLVTFLRDGYRQADNGRRNALTGLRSQQGVGTVVFTPTDYVTSTDPSEIVRSWSADGVAKNESDASVREAACAARVGQRKRRYGGPGRYEIALKPHIDMTDGSFRGYIDPQGGNLASFWEQYRQLILEQARLAIEIHASTLVIGTELTALSDGPDDEARWRALIAEIRGVSAPRYKCKRPGRERPGGAPVTLADAGIRLTFAANWDAIDRVRFWDALDMIGTDYYENGTNMSSIYSTVARVEAGLQSSGAGMRPFLFTEIGYDGATDPAGFSQGSADANQKAMYSNSFQTWIDAYRSGMAPWFSGFWWWDRYSQGGGGSTARVRDAFTPGPQTMATQCAFQCPATLSTVR